MVFCGFSWSEQLSDGDVNFNHEWYKTPEKSEEARFLGHFGQNLPSAPRLGGCVAGLPKSENVPRHTLRELLLAGRITPGFSQSTKTRTNAASFAHHRPYWANTASNA